MDEIVVGQAQAILRETKRILERFGWAKYEFAWWDRAEALNVTDLENAGLETGIRFCVGGAAHRASHHMGFAYSICDASPAVCLVQDALDDAVPAEFKSGFSKDSILRRTTFVAAYNDARETTFTDVLAWIDRAIASLGPIK